LQQFFYIFYKISGQYFAGNDALVVPCYI